MWYIGVKELYFSFLFIYKLSIESYGVTGLRGMSLVRVLESIFPFP